MKKVLCILMMSAFVLVNAQEKSNSYGLTAGFHSLTIDTSDDSATGSGFFVGLFSDFSVSEKISIQPEVHYTSASKDGESTDEIVVPVMIKYYVSDQFTVQAGPQFDYLLEDVGDEYTKLGIGLALGAGFDFSDNLFISTRYSFGLNNRFDVSGFDFDVKHNTFQIGLGYRF